MIDTIKDDNGTGLRYVYIVLNGFRLNGGLCETK